MVNRPPVRLGAGTLVSVCVCAAIEAGVCLVKFFSAILVVCFHSFFCFFQFSIHFFFVSLVKRRRQETGRQLTRTNAAKFFVSCLDTAAVLCVCIAHVCVCIDGS